jgi:hypothetical protein
VPGNASGVEALITSQHDVTAIHAQHLRQLRNSYSLDWELGTEAAAGPDDQAPVSGWQRRGVCRGDRCVLVPVACCLLLLQVV